MFGNAKSFSVIVNIRETGKRWEHIAVQQNGESKRNGLGGKW